MVIHAFPARHIYCAHVYLSSLFASFELLQIPILGCHLRPLPSSQAYRSARLFTPLGSYEGHPL